MIGRLLYYWPEGSCAQSRATAIIVLLATHSVGQANDKILDHGRSEESIRLVRQIETELETAWNECKDPSSQAKGNVSVGIFSQFRRGLAPVLPVI